MYRSGFLGAAVRELLRCVRTSHELALVPISPRGSLQNMLPQHVEPAMACCRSLALAGTVLAMLLVSYVRPLRTERSSVVRAQESRMIGDGDRLDRHGPADSQVPTSSSGALTRVINTAVLGPAAIFVVTLLLVGLNLLQRKSELQLELKVSLDGALVDVEERELRYFLKDLGVQSFLLQRLSVQRSSRNTVLVTGPRWVILALPQRLQFLQAPPRGVGQVSAIISIASSSTSAVEDDGTMASLASAGNAAVSSETMLAAPVVGPVRPLQPLQYTLDEDRGVIDVIFSVAESKLLSKDRMVLSKLFELPVGDSMVPFKIKVSAKEIHSGRRGQCFRTSGGCGKVELKCEGSPAGASPLVLKYRVGCGELAQTQRGPVTHDFFQSSVAGLPNGEDDWDFRSSVDKATGSFDVCVEVELRDPMPERLLEQAKAKLFLNGA